MQPESLGWWWLDLAVLLLLVGALIRRRARARAPREAASTPLRLQLLLALAIGLALVWVAGQYAHERASPTAAILLMAAAAALGRLLLPWIPLAAEPRPLISVLLTCPAEAIISSLLIFGELADHTWLATTLFVYVLTLRALGDAPAEAVAAPARLLGAGLAVCATGSELAGAVGWTLTYGAAHRWLHPPADAISLFVSVPLILLPLCPGMPLAGFVGSFPVMTSPGLPGGPPRVTWVPKDGAWNGVIVDRPYDRSLLSRVRSLSRVFSLGRPQARMGYLTFENGTVLRFWRIEWRGLQPVWRMPQHWGILFVDPDAPDDLLSKTHAEELALISELEAACLEPISADHPLGNLDQRIPSLWAIRIQGRTLVQLNGLSQRGEVPVIGAFTNRLPAMKRDAILALLDERGFDIARLRRYLQDPESIPRGAEILVDEPN